MIQGYLLLSQSQRRAIRERRAERYVQRFKRIVQRCDVCGRWNDGSAACHEIPRGGAYRLTARGKYFCCLLVCDGFRDCHRRMGGVSWATQLGYLYLSRPGHLRMGLFNRLFRPRIDVADVLRAAEGILEGRNGNV